MKNSYVFDTGPLYLSFAGDRRVTEPLREVRRGEAAGYTCEPNLAELFYKTCEKMGRETALLRYTSIRQSALEITPPDEALSRSAGQLKCLHRTTLSLVDAYAISLAKRTEGRLYTTDPRIARLKIVPTELLDLSRQI